MAWRESASSHHLGFGGFLVHTVVRFFQFALALAVLGLYGTDLNNARIAHVYADPRWIFAEVVGGLAAITAIIFMIPFIKTYKVFAWDFIIFFFWVVVFGIFGHMYINANPGNDAAVTRMKNAVWVDLAELLLWLISAVYGLTMFLVNRRGRSLHTGRAAV